MLEFIEAQFEKMGARAKVQVETRRRHARTWNGRVFRSQEPQAIRINVLRDGKGEYFEIRHAPKTLVNVLEVRRTDRHLLLHVRDAEDQKSKFLCGHDERAWFVAAIPESATVRNVLDAKDALKPEEVWESILAHNVPANQRNRRSTKAFVRQGEWFFIPRPELDVVGKAVVRNEPIRRGSGKPHVCQFLCRFGGEQVYVSALYPNGVTVTEFRELSVEERQGNWRPMVREPKAFVRGAIRHPDHATIHLAGWHEVVMNTESRAAAMSRVAFLD